MDTQKEGYIEGSREFISSQVAPALIEGSRLLVGPREYAHRVKYQGSHAATPAELVGVTRQAIKEASHMSLYAHMPICRHRCLFCHYPVIVSRGVVGRWLEAIERESRLVLAAMPEVASCPVSSLYLGGGTPTLATEAELGRLLDHLRASYSVGDSTEISIEGTPETYDIQKVRALKGLGINRVSIGVQSLDPLMLRINNRHHTAEQSLEAIGRLLEGGFDWVNVDLIYGFPGQSIGMLYDDVTTILGLKPDSITLYRLRLRRDDEGTTGLDYRYGKTPEFFPDALEVYAMQHMARQLMEEHGYLEGPSGWFSRRVAPIKVYHDRWVDQVPLVGLGWHTYSYSGLHEYHAQSQSTDYLAALEKGELPIERGTIYDKREQAERWVFFRLKSLFRVDLGDVEALFGTESWEEYGWSPFAERLVGLGLAGMSEEALTLTDAGKVLVEEIIR